MILPTMPQHILLDIVVKESDKSAKQTCKRRMTSNRRIVRQLVLVISGVPNKRHLAAGLQPKR